MGSALQSGFPVVPPPQPKRVLLRVSFISRCRHRLRRKLLHLRSAQTEPCLSGHQLKRNPINVERRFSAISAFMLIRAFLSFALFCLVGAAVRG